MAVKRDSVLDASMYLFCLFVKIYAIRVVQRHNEILYNIAPNENDDDSSSASSIDIPQTSAFRDSGEILRYEELLAEFIIQLYEINSVNLQKYMRRAITRTEKVEEFCQIFECIKQEVTDDTEFSQAIDVLNIALKRYDICEDRHFIFSTAYIKMYQNKDQQTDQQPGTETVFQLNEEYRSSILSDPVKKLPVNIAAKMLQIHAILSDISSYGESKYREVGMTAKFLRLELNNEEYGIVIRIISTSSSLYVCKFGFREMKLYTIELTHGGESKSCSSEFLIRTPNDLINWCMQSIDYLEKGQVSRYIPSLEDSTDSDKSDFD